MSALIASVAASPIGLRALAVLGWLGLAGFVALVTWTMSGLHVGALIVALVIGTAVVLWPATGVLLLLATLIFKYPEVIQRLPLGPNRILAGVLALLLIGALATRQRLDFLRARPYQVFVAIVALVVANAVLVGSAEAPANLAGYDITDRTVERMLTQLALMTFFGAFIRTRRHMLLVVGLFMVALLITVPGAVTHSYSVIGDSLERGRAVAVAGIQSAANANRLAFLANMGIAFTWFAALHYRRRALTLVAAPVILSLVLAVLLSGSRSGLMTLALLVVLLALQSGARPGPVAALTLLAVVTVGVGLLAVPDQIRERILSFLPAEHPDSATASTNLRLLMIQEGLRLAAENPFLGVGVGNIRWMTALAPATGGLPLTMHDAYLLALVEGGVLLLAAYLLLFWCVWRTLSQVIARAATRPDLGLEWVAKATRTQLVLLLLFSFFADAWNEFHFQIIIAMSIGLAALYTQPSPTSQRAAVRWPLPQSST